jgi:hypothetical protein
MSCLTYICYAGFYGLSQNTIVPSLAISIFCLLGYISSTSPALTMPKYCFAFVGYIDTLPLELFTSWATLPLGLLCLLGCLLGYFASWAALPLGLLCLLGCFASWATLPLGLCLIDIVCFDNAGILICLLRYFNMLPLGPCLIDIVCFDNAGILICLLGCAIAGHLLVCKNDKLC